MFNKMGRQAEIRVDFVTICQFDGHSFSFAILSFVDETLISKLLQDVGSALQRGLRMAPRSQPFR